MCTHTFDSTLYKARKDRTSSSYAVPLTTGALAVEAKSMASKRLLSVRGVREPWTESLRSRGDPERLSLVLPSAALRDASCCRLAMRHCSSVYAASS